LSPYLALPFDDRGGRKQGSGNDRQSSRVAGCNTRRTLKWFAIVVALLASIEAAAAIQPEIRLYGLYCGEGHAPDQARWSPGVNVGKPLDISDNCYLIHHPRGWFLWDTGIADAVADRAEGGLDEKGAPTWRRAKKTSHAIDGARAPAGRYFCNRNIALAS
jgi:hypothetical protein